MTRDGNFWKAFGPGLLFAAMAVGASHLIQSTRAGAGFGLGLIGLVVLTNLVKYPAFRFGAEYASLTGHSLLEGYLRQGRWAVAIYLLVALGTMFAAMAAVTLASAGLAREVFNLDMDPLLLSSLILCVCWIILAVGRFRLLDWLIKVLMVVLAVSTLVATALVVPNIEWSLSAMFPRSLGESDMLFLAALIGFMPVSLDVSIWHSLWAIAKEEDTHHRAQRGEALLDFHIGYFGTIVLAVCFLLLGAGVMYDAGIEFEAGASGFAAQLIGLYTQTLGAWAGPMLGAAALAVMFSTVLAGLDGYPRVAVAFARLLKPAEAANSAQLNERRIYRLAMGVEAVGALIILQAFVSSLKLMVDVAATLAFLFAPLIAWLNHRAMVDRAIAEAQRPAAVLRVWSLFGVACLLAVALYYLYLRFWRQI